MSDVSSLQIKVDSAGAVTGASNLDKLTDSAGAAEMATEGFSAVWEKLTELMGAYVSIEGAFKALEKVADITEEFDKFDAQLKIATGSAANAKIALEALREIAAASPFTLEETVSAFTDLVNKGLDPSERALKSYGNTATALNKSLSDVTGAVAQASNGMYRGLQELGVKATQDATGLQVTFQGVTSHIEDNAASIQNYLIALGENHFGDAMANQVDTMGGKINTLKTAWDDLWLEVSKAGVGDLIKQGIDVATEALQGLTRLVASGELLAYIDAIIHKFDGFADIVVSAYQKMRTGVKAVQDGMTDDEKDWLSKATDAVEQYFENLPEITALKIKLVGVALEAIVDFIVDVGKGMISEWEATWVLAYEVASDGIQKIASLRPGADSFDWTSAIKVALKDYAATSAATAVSVAADIEKDATARATQGVNDMIQTAQEIANFKARITAANALGAAYDKLHPPVLNTGGDINLPGMGKPDPLAGFQKTQTGPTQEYTTLMQSLKTQEQLLQESYDHRKTVIEANTVAESDAQDTAMAALWQSYTDAKKKMLDSMNADVPVQATVLEDQNAINMAVMLRGFDQQQETLDKALAAKLISEQDYANKSLVIEQRRTLQTNNLATTSLAAVKAHQFQIYSDVLTMAANMAGQLTTLVQGNNAAAKAMFIVSKGIAIASAIVNTELAATKALATDSIFGIPLSEAIRATGYASVAIMAAQDVSDYSGQFDHGGMIPAGKWGIAGENGPEPIMGPAVVTSTRNAADRAGSGSNGGNLTVNVNNYAGVEVTATQTNTATGKQIDIVIKQAEKQIASNVDAGTGPLSNVLKTRFNLNRGRK